MPQFHSIDFGELCKEQVRNDLSVNKAGKISEFFIFLLSCVYPIKEYFDDFVLFRNKKLMISKCDWTKGNVTNVLNILFDSIQKRIYITQSSTTNVFLPTFSYESDVFLPTFSEESSVYLGQINENQSIKNLVYFWLPSDLYNNSAIKQEIINTIEQIKLYNTNYSILEII